MFYVTCINFEGFFSVLSYTEKPQNFRVLQQKKSCKIIEKTFEGRKRREISNGFYFTEAYIAWQEPIRIHGLGRGSEDSAL